MGCFDATNVGPLLGEKLPISPLTGLVFGYGPKGILGIFSTPDFRCLLKKLRGFPLVYKGKGWDRPPEINMDTKKTLLKRKLLFQTIGLRVHLDKFSRVVPPLREFILWG